MMADIEVRKGMPSVELSQEEFKTRYRSRFSDPAFDPLNKEITAIVDVAWDGYIKGRKSPRTAMRARNLPIPTTICLSIGWLRAMRSLRRKSATTIRSSPSAS